MIKNHSGNFQNITTRGIIDMVELYLLEQLIEVQKCGTLSAAAASLNITQSALSRSMQKLEDALGVKLFIRSKNKLVLSPTGEYTVTLALKYIEYGESLIKQVQDFEKNNFRISYGACAPCPDSDFRNLIKEKHPEMAISSELAPDDELIKGLLSDKYLFVVLHTQPADNVPENLFVKQYGQEQLYLNVPKSHHLSKFNELTFSMINGNNLLLYYKTGFWEEICRLKMPDSHFLMIRELDALGEIIGASSFPSFNTDISIANNQVAPDQLTIPITDEEASVTYYFVCKANNKRNIMDLGLLE
jgi:DNA-binding transcriptional LysR family regulator